MEFLISNPKGFNMKEYIVEYFNAGSSIPLATRQWGYSEANARSAAKAEKGHDIIIRSTRPA